MQLSAARDELAGRGFDYLSSTRMTLMLNDGKNALEDEFPWPWLETTTTGAAPLTIADLKSILYVQDTTNDSELLGLPAQQIAVGGTDLTLAGAPEYWWLDGVSTLSTWPVSTSAQLSVRYVKFSPELSADADTPLIPTRYHSVWLDYAVIYAYRDSDNYEAANALLGYVRQFRLQQMVEAYAARNRQNPSYQTMRSGSFDD